eukprot:NP_001254067.1 Uncharacterized protein CELE_F02E11.7 [Caenorhabditis elegans]
MGDQIELVRNGGNHRDSDVQRHHLRPQLSKQSTLGPGPHVFKSSVFKIQIISKVIFHPEISKKKLQKKVYIPYLFIIHSICFRSTFTFFRLIFPFFEFIFLKFHFKLLLFRMSGSGEKMIMTRKITLGTDQDPYNKEELVNTLKGRELGFFVIFYIFAVMCIVMAFEFFKPIIFTDNYPN